MTHLTRNNNPNIFASLPFDQIDGFAGTSIHDDFITASTVADYIDVAAGAAQPSEFPWQGCEIAANAAVANGLTIPGEVDHAGILQIQTGGTTPGDGDGVAIQLGDDAANIQDTLVLDDNGVYMATVVRILDVSDQSIEFGLIGQQPIEPNTVTGADIVSILFDPADADNVGDEFFFAEAYIATVDTEVIGTVTYVESDWVLLEVSANDTGAAYRITTEDGTETLEIVKSMPTVALRPAISTANIGSNEELLDIDLFHLRFLRRDSLLGNAADWLGA